MVTTTTEGIHIFKILLDWCSPKVARMMLDDMDFYIAETTDNESLRDSIKMVRQYLYDMSEENEEIINEEQQHYVALIDIMAKQRGMTRE